VEMYSVNPAPPSYYTLEQADGAAQVLGHLSGTLLNLTQHQALLQEHATSGLQGLCNWEMTVLDEEEALPFLHGTLKIHVIEAADLPDTDNCFFNIDRGDLTDAFVLISLGETPLLKTAYIPNSLNPRWDEKFSIPVCHRASYLKVMVRDREHIGDKAVGSCLISTEELVDGSPIEGWYDITVGADGETHGSFHIMLQYFPVGSLDEDPFYLNEAYFQPKTHNQVVMYMTAETPQLPVFEGVCEPDGSPFIANRCWLDIFKAMCNAQKLIYVTGWSVFTGISLVRGEEACYYPDSNVGEILKRKAAEGVRVLVMTWNEKSNDGGMLEGMMGTHDEDTNSFFAGTDVICTNVPRSKKSWLGLGGQFVGTLYTHHQKTIICDTELGDGSDRRKLVAFVGGIDITDGRYDTPEFHLYKTINTVHAGDFYQNCTVGATLESGPREPWQDIHAMVMGPAAVDILDNFADRWCQQNCDMQECLYYLTEDEFALDDPVDVPEEQGGTWNVQLFRSITSDSAVMAEDRIEYLNRKYGRPMEDSIMRQYVNLIRGAKSFIYIENQYFLGSAFGWLEDQTTLSHHVVPIELAEKIISKIDADEPFHVYVTIPMYPEGDPCSTPSQEIIRWQFRTIEMIYKRVYRALQRNGSDNHPQDYITFYCLGKRESPDEVPEDIGEPAPGSGAEIVRETLRHPIYVHSKLMVVDDAYLVVGSANINQRSLGGNRDSEICIGGYQPAHQHDGDQPPRGAVHTFRLALWSSHLGGYDEAYENPGSWDCVERVRAVSSEFWEIYTADEPVHSDIHLLPYPLAVSEMGDVSSLDAPWDTFPDTLAPVVGTKSGILPVKLTT